MKTYPTLVPVGGYNKIVEAERPDLEPSPIITLEQCFAANHKLHAKLKIATDALREIVAPKKPAFFIDQQLLAAKRVADEALNNLGRP